MAVLGKVASLTAPRIIECEWQSRIPGVTCSPVPSISWTAGPAVSEEPTACIFPLATSRSARDRVPSGPLVQIVALRIITEPGWAMGPRPSIGGWATRRATSWRSSAFLASASTLGSLRSGVFKAASVS